ncbi:unnamed protein product, partial [Symbiodinium microadriaticum]
MLGHRRQWLRLVCPRCHRFQPLEQPLEHQRRHLLPPLRRSEARSLELLQRQLRPLPHPRDLTSQSRSRIPWNMTWIWLFGQTQGSVVGRAALPTSFLCLVPSMASSMSSAQSASMWLNAHVLMQAQEATAFTQGLTRDSSEPPEDAEVAWDAEQTELAVEVPLEAEEEPIMEDETDSCESVLVEAEDPQAEDNAAEGGDIPQPSTPPAAATEGDQMEEANDLAMQDESGQNQEYYEDPASQSAGRPGWLFNADVMAFAKAYGIRSAFVGDKEILIPRPKQAPAPGSTPTTTEIEHPARETPALELPPRPKRRSETVTRPIEEGTFTGMAHRVESPPASGMTSDAQIEASCLLPERMNTRRSKWPGWKYSKPAFNPDGSSRRWRTSLVAINLRRPWNYNWRQLFQEMNCTWQLLSTSSVHAAWRLACGYRLAFSRHRWPQIQAKLASMTGHPKCESIHRLVRAHQRLE